MTKMLVLGNITSNVFLRSRHAANMQKLRPVLWPVLAKSFSFSSERITVETNTNTGIATFTMHNKPVNNMGYSFLEESIEAFKGLEKSNCRALIITSSLPRVFCAGLDFNEIVKPEQKRLIKYWKLFEDFITASYSAKFATISAINSVAAAGGCVLALSTDYRIASQQAIIGLNEVAISLPLQEWIFKMCANVTGNRNAEFVSLTGKMFNSEAALRLGLVDEMASDSKELLEKAENQAKVYASLPDIESWYITKMEARKSLVNLIKERKIDSGVFLDSINSPSTQTILGSYASKLKKK